MHHHLLTTPETHSPVIPNNVEEDNHDLDVAYMSTDPFFGILVPENDSEASSSSDVIPTVVHTATPNLEHVTKWTKDHPLENIIGELERPVSTRLLHEQALFCYYDVFLTSVEPKNYKDALTQGGVRRVDLLSGRRRRITVDHLGALDSATSLSGLGDLGALDMESKMLDDEANSRVLPIVTLHNPHECY
ncbi:hypothetical protein Tco_0748184 [Tanacetum coccineum]|uniref:Uncharacterized protein n=1 Tax=Tanacetum coccineum TaxID=301880 RepID=A0ABQ4YV28_9ASTR